MPDSREANRLRALRFTQLLDSDAERAFDRLTRMAASLVHAPTALVSLVDENRQFFKSAFGLPEPWASLRETPLTHSLCQYATRDRAPLILSDAREHPILRDNLAVRDLGVVAYAGMPLFVHDEAIGVFCVIDDKPRVWSEQELSLLKDLAESVVSEIELRLSLRAAHEQHALTDALLDGLGDAVLGIDTSRRFVLANAAARRIFADGAEAGQPLPPNWSQLHQSILSNGSSLPPEDGALHRALRGEKTDDLEFSLLKPGAAAPIWVEAKGRPVLDQEERVIAGVAVYRDITDRKRRTEIEASTRRQELLYRLVVQNLPRGAVFLIDENLTYLSADGPLLTEVMAQAAVPVEQLVGRTIDDVVSPKNREATKTIVRAALAGQSQRVEISRGDFSYELVAEPLADGIFGKISTAILFCYDVTPFKQARDAMDREHAVQREALIAANTFRLMVEAVHDYAIFQLDAEGRVKTWNAGAQAIKGYEAGEIIGSHISIFYPETDRRRVDSALDAAAATGHSEDEGWRVRENGSRFWANVIITALRDPQSNQLLGFLNVTRDLTERKRTEDANARSLAEKTAMLHEIHHRVKNNLQMISSLLNLQSRQIKDDDARSVFLETQGRVRSIALLHESLYQSDDLGRVDMQQYLPKLTSTLERTIGAESPRVRFVLAVERILLPVDVSVPCALIINELVTNAMKHAFGASRDSARNEIRIEMRQVGHRISIAVSDNGSGFSGVVDPTNVETMGLALVHDLSVQLNGVAAFTNSHGARCTVEFPAPRIEA